LFLFILCFFQFYNNNDNNNNNNNNNDNDNDNDTDIDIDIDNDIQAHRAIKLYFIQIYKQITNYTNTKGTNSDLHIFIHCEVVLSVAVVVMAIQIG
jgi:hypothetical protein